MNYENARHGGNRGLLIFYNFYNITMVINKKAE